VAIAQFEVLNVKQFEAVVSKMLKERQSVMDRFRRGEWAQVRTHSFSA
jgi:hypothetical protein